ncbi:MAG TPA: hypothetical protein PK659_09420 [Methanothrix sp.]|nr:hypothetical protein [Methanothrix sp.]HOK59045.1 hypothetical protein [Methanothrix sp.]HOL44458.1 hypothetical protein [Methanothrix sp.]HPO89329.1 hypothetical protein [Methanothrix sp.]
MSPTITLTWDVSLSLGELDYTGTLTIRAFIEYDEEWTWRGGVLRYVPYVDRIHVDTVGLPPSLGEAITKSVTAMYTTDRQVRELIDSQALQAHAREVEELRWGL